MKLVEPFPIEQLPAMHHWLASCPVIARAPEFPAEWDVFYRQMCGMLPRVRSWAVYGSDGRLAGCIILEPVGEMGAQAYVVSARWAWGKGTMDAGARDMLAQAFEGGFGGLGHIFAVVMDGNDPARAFVERVGMKLKNVFPVSRSRLYEITREQFADDCGPDGLRL